MTTYYNEHDPKAAAWLRELARSGAIPPGVVDERSIRDVQPADLAGFTQCHFFAGISGWSYALRLAGWPDNRPVWTGSCPCQPFSAAGQQKGEADELHLWPDFFRLIKECRPAIIFGEQVASSIALQWLDGVCADLEGEGYACGAGDLCAAGVGAPHIRQRLYWVGESDRARREPWQSAPTSSRHGHSAESAGGFGGVAVTHEQGCAGQSLGLLGASGEGHWSNFDILPCLDGKQRRVESGAFPLVARLPRGVVPSGDCSVQEAQSTPEARVMRLKGYGNAIVPQVAAQFIQAYQEATA